MAKILVLSCKGGGGHMSAAVAVQTSLVDHEVEIIDFLGETLSSIDPIYWLSFGRWGGPDLYNFLLRTNSKKCTNLLYHIGWVLFALGKPAIKKAVNRLCDSKKPDLIISVIPMANSHVACVSQKRDIPFLLIPTDLDVRSFTAGLNKTNNQTTWLGLGFDDTRVTSFVNCDVVQPEQITHIGFPVRRSFNISYNKKLGRESLALPLDKYVVLLVMGATGSPSLITYMKALGQLKIPLHVLVCLGRNSALASLIQALKLPSTLSYTLLNDDADMAVLMAVSDLCISKPGSVTFAETIYSCLPVFLDATGPALIWEAFNLGFVRRFGNGRVITTYEQVPRMITRFFTDHAWRLGMQKAVNSLEKKSFYENLNALVKRILLTSKNNH